MKYLIKVKRTGEISEKEWADIVAGFNTTFGKNYDKSYLEKKYYLSSLSQSFHSFLFNEENIVGMISAIPRQYSYFGKVINIALCCDAFILKQHRKDEGFLKEMAEILFRKLEEADIRFSISLPNNLAFSYWKYFGIWKYFGRMRYYSIPLRPGKISGKIRIFDGLVYLSFRAISVLFQNIYTEKSDPGNISLLKDEKYFTERYFDDYRVRVLKGNSKFVYKVYDEEGVRTAYLFDCVPFTKKCIARSLAAILRESGPDIDLILFIGNCDNPFYLLRVPSSMEPREQRILGFCSDRIMAEEFFKYDNWELSLANFDNR